MAGTVQAESPESVLQRLERLEQENRHLLNEIEALKSEIFGEDVEAPPVPAPVAGKSGAQFIRFDPEHGYAILDPTTNINRKQRLLLQQREQGDLASGALRVEGAITAIANYQSSNRDDKFGYLMRHPTGANQVGNTVSEATIHSVQLGLTGTAGDWITGHAEMLFDPQQSFGEGTVSDLERNQVQVRHAYAVFGSRERSPFYLSLGKMAVPFGLTDTVNPFSASTVWHAFGALANGVTAGYAADGLSLSVTGIQGGAQFRAANMPVEGTAVPSLLNNYALDAHYSFDRSSLGSLLLGGSYQRGTAYCQDFPVVHFEACRDNNPALAVYGKLVYGNTMLKGEVARTTDTWPGTFNPGIPQFPASKVTAFDIGGRHRHDFGAGPVDFSAEFSRFRVGPNGAPWERQDQIVLGTAWFLRPDSKLFAEYIRTIGYAPLNFISGGSVRDEQGDVIPDQTHSDRSAHSDVILIGVTVAF